MTSPDSGSRIERDESGDNSFCHPVLIGRTAAPEAVVSKRAEQNGGHRAVLAMSLARGPFYKSGSPGGEKINDDIHSLNELFKLA